MAAIQDPRLRGDDSAEDAGPLSDFLLVSLDKIGHAVEFPLNRVFTLGRCGGAESFDVMPAVNPYLGHALAGGLLP